MRRKEIGSSSGGGSNDRMKWFNQTMRVCFGVSVSVCMVQIVAIMLFLSSSPHFIEFTLCEYTKSLDRRFNLMRCWKAQPINFFLSHFFSVTLDVCLCPPRDFLSRPLFVNTPLTFKYLRKHKSKALLFTFLTFSLSRGHHSIITGIRVSFYVLLSLLNVLFFIQQQWQRKTKIEKRKSSHSQVDMTRIDDYIRQILFL